MKRLKLWLRAVRAPFFVASLIPILVGAALAFRDGNFKVIFLSYAMMIIISSHAGANLLNDYFDAPGSDRINTNYTPFSGGTRLIPDGIFSSSSFLWAAIIMYGLSLTTAFVLTFVYSNWLIFYLAVSGVLIGICYSGTFVCGMRRGWGEIMVGAAFGPLSVMGSYLLQTNYISKESFLSGIPVGFLVMGILILNEFPDVKADGLSGKRNWIVSLGIDKGVWIYLATLAMAYGTILAGVIVNVFPARVLYSYLSIPLAVWIILKLWRYREKVPEIIPAMAGNIGLHIITGLLICIGILV